MKTEAIMQRLCQMRGLDLLTPRQVCDRARQFDASRALIGTRRQVELSHRRPHQSLTFILQSTKLPNLSLLV